MTTTPEAATSRLVQLGFSTYEARTYVGLLATGPATGYAVANATGFYRHPPARFPGDNEPGGGNSALGHDPGRPARALWPNDWTGGGYGTRFPTPAGAGILCATLPHRPGRLAHDAGWNCTRDQAIIAHLERTKEPIILDELNHISFHPGTGTGAPADEIAPRRPSRWGFSPANSSPASCSLGPRRSGQHLRDGRTERALWVLADSSRSRSRTPSFSPRCRTRRFITKRSCKT